MLADRRAAALAAWLLLGLAGAAAIVRIDIAERRDAFESDARIAHRVLSQRAAQHDAMLATLVLLGPTGTADRPEQRLPALYPQLVGVLRRDAGRDWPDAALVAAEGRSRVLRHAALGPVDAQRGRCWLVLAGERSSYALHIDLHRVVPANDWPLPRGGPVRAELVHGAARVVLQPGAPAQARPAGLTQGFGFAKVLATASQPFELRLQRATGPAEWPWGTLLAWLVASGIACYGVLAWQRLRAERRRSAQLMRLSQAARLNTLGELAAGMTHELNQPLTAVLASAQTALRLFDGDGEPDLPSAREALVLAAAQARRAADVLARLRRLVQQPQADALREPVQMSLLARQLLDLLAPELRRRGIEAQLHGRAPLVWADPVALEQVVHNLVDNAMQALEDTPPDRRRLTLQLDGDDRHGRLAVRDSGPGIAAELLPRLFQPFVTTRRGGLGLGLSLSETLAQSMGGRLAARNLAPSGAEVALELPLAKGPSQ